MLSRFTCADLTFIPDSDAYILILNVFDKRQRSVEEIKMQESLHAVAPMRIYSQRKACNFRNAQVFQLQYLHCLYFSY